MTDERKRLATAIDGLCAALQEALIRMAKADDERGKALADMGNHVSHAASVINDIRKEWKT